MSRTISQTINLQDNNIAKYITKIDDGGIKIHDSQRQDLDYLQLTSSGIDIKQNNISLASFATTGARIGQSGKSHLEMDYHSMQMVDKDGITYFKVNDLRMDDGSIIAEFTGDGTTTDYILPVYPYWPSDATNTLLTINGVAKTYGFEDDYTLFNTATYGGLLLTTPAAVGASIVLRYKPGEGVDPKALTFGNRNTYMSGMGAFSATFGSLCAAMSDNTVALNKGTIAYMPNQTAVGAYNEIDDNGRYALIIGNGTADDARSNAFTVDWSGNVDIPEGASYKVGGTAIADYIVDEGTYYSWKYRKWASGTAECWGIGSSTSTHYTTLFGGYAYTAQFNLPPIFNATPIVTYSCNGGGAFNVTGTQTSSTTSTTVAVYSVSNTSGQKTLSWRMYVIGTWK